MLIIIDTDRPQEITIKEKYLKDEYSVYIGELKGKRRYKNFLNEIDEISKLRRLPKSDYSIDDIDFIDDSLKSPKYNDSIEDFKKYLQQIIMEPNKLSEKEIRDLGNECLKWVDVSTRYRDISIGIIGDAISFNDCHFKRYWQELADIINEYTHNNNNLKSWDNKDFDFNPVEDLKLILPFRDLRRLYHSCTCGALNMRFYKFLYYFDFIGIPIKDDELKRFWNFYKKTLNVYAISLKNYSSGCRIYILPRFDEIYIKNNVSHYIYKNDFYCDSLEVPKNLYYIDREDMKLSDFSKYSNTDIRTIFIKKVGLEKFIKRGFIVDAYENYPDNEWWAKSEYKLIDMKHFITDRVIKESTGRIIDITHPHYAPYLCMKNQTTDEYHLEGVSPNCRNLYDALKMRYKGLNLPEYKIEDIK